MAINNIKTVSIGEAGQTPRIIYIDSTDTVATATTAGYLTSARDKLGYDFTNKDMCLFYSSTDGLAWLEVVVTTSAVSLQQAYNPGSVVLPTVANHIAVYTNTGGTLSDDAATAINGGNIQAGLSGTAGYVSSFPSTASKGSLRLTAVANTGDTVTTVSNAAMGQASVISIPDPGQATSEFIIADSASTQTITSGNLTVAAGTIDSGVTGGGVTGKFTAWATTASNGSIALQATDNGGDFDVIVTNGAHGQDTTYTINDIGESAGSILVNLLDAADTNANTVTFDITVGQGDLASAGSVTLQASSGSKQYKIRELYLNGNGTNFAGGGGDRLATISDGTTDYSVIPAATLQSLANARWGDSDLPFPASAAINVSTAAGAALTIAYSGGTTDYTSGSMVISGVLERVA